MDIESPVTFGEWLRQSRDKLRLTRREFADRIGCSVSMLRKIEEGERWPSAQIAELIANCLGVPPADHATFIKVARGEWSIERLVPISERLAGPVVHPASAPLRTNLPLLPTPLVGRQRDLDELNTLLRDPQCRLLTLAGPGGIGKTRLAIEAASRTQDFFAGGPYFVSLAQVTSSRFIVPLIANALGFAFQRESFVDPKLQLVHYLQDKQALLLLDNLEHLLNEPGIELISELLEQAPQVKQLVTSRESVGLYQEWVFEVQGLPLPEGGLAEGSPQGTAVELFLQRARRAQVRFNPTKKDYPAIVHICRLVEGMPLGIELAAAWVQALSCAEIAREIERGLDFLSLSARDLPARHRSLRAVFDHSWKLLSEKEQDVLLRLSIFQGGFGRAAAEAVAGASLPVLSKMVTKSLLRRSAAGRYDLHELVRQYAFEQFSRDHPANQAQTQARHARYYLTYLGERDERLRGPAQQAALAELSIEIENIRIAWDWAVQHGEFTLIEGTLRAFSTFFDNRGLFQEGLDYLSRATSALEATGQSTPPARDDLVALGHLLASHGLLAFRLAQIDQAQAVLERSLEILRSLDEPRVLVETLTFLGIVVALKGNFTRAQELFGAGLETAAQIGDPWFRALCLTEQISMSQLVGSPEDAYGQYQAAVADWRAIGDPRFTAFGLYFLSSSALDLGKYTEARAALEESIMLNRSVGDRWGLGSAYRGLGLVAQAQGEHVQALEAFQKSLDILVELGARWDAARDLADIGRSFFALGNLSEAERVWRESLEISLDVQGILVGLDAVVGLARLQAKRGSLETALEWLWVVADHPASIQETRDHAAQLRADLEAQLTNQQADTVRARAKGKTFQIVVEDILRPVS